MRPSLASADVALDQIAAIVDFADDSVSFARVICADCDISPLCRGSSQTEVIQHEDMPSNCKSHNADSSFIRFRFAGHRRVDINSNADNVMPLHLLHGSTVSLYHIPGPQGAGNVFQQFRLDFLPTEARAPVRVDNSADEFRR